MYGGNGLKKDEKNKNGGDYGIDGFDWVDTTGMDMTEKGTTGMVWTSLE